MSSFPLEEPSADNRALAKACRELFVGLVNEGFSEPQALTILGTILATSIGGAK